ncbi:folylpolyglutamate synthase/dihydrofolate synthase family protein [Echinicola jeungdonensis]|uniref:Dihydrofolate synthase/folylpolyglutamate synthase n=1 Tax=Echinicola jeungdonensis TaxID=709343 RepID=A0ABV5J5F8_9BACT|nr:folylpolyglutamate synthase/dihydrofolate synthase family protein [Echinicola jeungdonensis]MDN3670875.1 folylpolyglutamate synthase/dihydrofolate synthase family protein [Echinicola jeungdonensis]
MNYQETLDYLFNALPMFQRVGAAAFKKDLGNTVKLCKQLGNPQDQFKSIHIAGTNGKGSSSHMLASVLQVAGYKVGLYTSPHLKSFTERIKINGKEIPPGVVVDFVKNNKEFLDQCKPSFFEMTVGLAFAYFAAEKVDYAVIEVGMGGRFDSTNIINPELCLITNIGLDHTQFLGETIAKIAFEKGGIIKENVPVIISQTQEEAAPEFKEIAFQKNAPIYFADQYYQVFQKGLNKHNLLCDYQLVKCGIETVVSMDLFGQYQEKNLPGVLKVLDILGEMGLKLNAEAIHKGLAHAASNTHLKGRFQKLQEEPLVYCDTGHNVDGMTALVKQIRSMDYDRLYMVLGMVNDKDITQVLALLPKEAHYIFCQAKLPRALDAKELKDKAFAFQLHGEIIRDVNMAFKETLKKAGKKDLIFVGGSTFVVAELENL